MDQATEDIGIVLLALGLTTSIFGFLLFLSMLGSPTVITTDDFFTLILIVFGISLEIGGLSCIQLAKSS